MSVHRPSRLIYALNERPPFIHLLLLGLQYACMCFPYLIIVVILDRTQGGVSSSPISFSLIALGIAALIQSIHKGPIGSGYLAPSVISAIYFPASMSAVMQGGLHLVYGMTLFAGFFEVIFSFFIKSLRKYFPPIVCGLIIIAVGFQLGLLAISQSLAITIWNHPLYDRHLIASALTLLTMIALTVWAKGMWRLLSPFIGIVVGFSASFILGIVPPLQKFNASAWFAFPSFSFIGYSFSWDLALPFFLAAIASSLRVVGGVTTCQKMNNAVWHTADLKNIKKGLFADGMGCFIGGLLGVPGINMAPSLIGVSQATGATSRSIAYCLAAWMFLLAFVPKVIYLFLAIPLSVMGAALLYTASFMIAGGIDLMTTRKVDTRAILIIGVSLLLGISQPVFSQYYGNLPPFLKMFTNSLLSVVTLSAFLLNLVFRFGVRQKVTMNGKIKTKEGVDQILNEKMREWDLSKETSERMRQSLRGLVGQLEKGYLKEGEIRLSMIYDPVEAILRFNYLGTIPKLSFEVDTDKEMIEETSFTEGFENYSLDISADHIITSTKDANCIIELYFFI